MGKKQDKSAKGTIKPAASMTMGPVSRLKEFFTGWREPYIWEWNSETFTFLGRTFWDKFYFTEK